MTPLVNRLTRAITTTFLAATSSIAQAPGRIEVDGARPMMEMVDRLEALSGVAINYEDPQYVNPNDIEDVADRVLTAAQRSRNPSVKILVPRGGKLSLTLPPSGEKVREADIGPYLTQMRMAYETKKLPGRFAITQRNGMWYVEPSSEAQGDQGDQANQGVAPAMGTRITIPRQRRNAGKYLELILGQIAQKNGSKVATGTIPYGAFATTQVDLGADDESAAVVVSRLLAELSRGSHPNVPATPRLSYRFLYDPGFKNYVFNVRVVEPIRPAGPDVDRPVITPPVPGSGRPGEQKIPD